MTTSQEAAAERNVQTVHKVCYRFMLILCLNGTEGLLLLYTWRQNKCLYYYKWVDLKPFEINHLYVLFTCSDMQTCTITPRGGYILFTCCHWTCQHRVWWGSGRCQQDSPWPGFPCTHSPGAAACQAETMTVLMQLILPSTGCQWHSSDCTCWWQPCQELPAILAPPGFVPLAISERCSWMLWGHKRWGDNPVFLFF